MSACIRVSKVQTAVDEASVAGFDLRPSSMRKIRSSVALRETVERNEYNSRTAESVN